MVLMSIFFKIYKYALLCYNLFRTLLESWSISYPFFIIQIPTFSVMYNYKVLVFKLEVILPITYYMIPVDFCQQIYIINFSTENMTLKFELYSKNKINALCIIEIMRTDWLHMLD